MSSPTRHPGPASTRSRRHARRRGRGARCARLVAASTAVAALAACGPDGAPLLTELERYSGSVLLEFHDELRDATLDVDLAFDRTAGSFELASRDAPGIVLRKDGDGPLRVLENGAERGASGDETRDFQMVWMAVHSTPDELVRVSRRATGYEIAVDGVRLRVTYRPVRG